MQFTIYNLQVTKGWRRSNTIAAIPLAIACLWTGAGQGLQGVLHAQGDAGAPVDVAKLVSALRAPAVEARIATVQALVAMGAGAAPAIGVLIDLLKESDGIVELTTRESGDRVFSFNPVQTLATDVLVTIGAPAVEPMRAALQAADPAELQMSYLAASLVRTAQPVALATVQEMLRHPTPMVRRRAADALAFSRDTASIDALIAALGDKDPDVRVDVADALERLSGRRYGQDAASWAAWREVWVAR